ncbi:MAG TPA: hypothetical protein PKE32_02315 [Miltoncostaeaceae bacterium]|nr:hypothetical protein [Miltoncostaeaceae bacterium]
MPTARRRTTGAEKRRRHRLVALALLVAAIFALVLVLIWWNTRGPGPSVTPGHRLASLAAPEPFGTGPARNERFAWPVKPFDRPHVLRATFGEPRGIKMGGAPRDPGPQRARYLNRMGQLTLGRRSLHTGVDIVAADGTPVYALTSGTAQVGGQGTDLHVIVGGFGYWHLTDAVPAGSPVTAFRTIIGRVTPGQGHVHLTRFNSIGPQDNVPGDRSGDPVNPLVAGGLTPYTDTAAPRLGGLVAFDAHQKAVPLHAITGPIVLAVNADDIQSEGGTSVGLYTLGYQVLDSAGRTVVAPQDVLRFDTLPDRTVADRLYTVASTRDRFRTDFWYRLTTRSPSDDGFLHAERLSPGRYIVRVSAGDARANSTTRDYPIRVGRP